MQIVVAHPEFVAQFSNFYREEKKTDNCDLCAVSAVRFETGTDPHPLVHASNKHLTVEKFIEAANAENTSPPEPIANLDEEMMITKTNQAQEILAHHQKENLILQQAILEESEEVKAKTSVLENMMERLAKLE